MTRERARNGTGVTSVITRTRLTILLFLLAAKGATPLHYQSIEAYANGDECALVLDGPGRTSVFDYTYNLLRGSFPPTAGSQTCITYDAVNNAYIEARKRINVAQSKADIWRPEDLATVGELLLDISVNLAQTYGLTYEEIEKSLPLIDTSRTLIREVCPAFLSNVECRPGKYRRYDGLCTNLENPTWGSSLSPFSRLLPPRFADGLTAPRISVTGGDLPLARVVSRTMHPDEGYHDHAGTVMVIAWGQFMDHDYTLTATPLDPLNRNDPEECCSRPPHLKNPYCNEIYIPEDDYFYRLFNVRCMDFVRAFPAVRPGCRLGSRVPFNLLTGVLDGNTVYGISEHFARKLRTGYGGLLRMNPVFSEYGLKDLLPLKLDIPDEGCTRPNRSMYCFEAGEIRVNEQLVLTCMHTLMAREHNRAAKALAHVNPHWDDETIFQEARRIVIAEIQHVTYNEFLPILLGKDVMEKFGLLLEKDGYWDGYDPSVNPGVLDAFASAAFRFGHSLLPTAVERWSKAHKFIASKRLSDLIRRPYDLYRAGVLDEYFMGLMNQVAQAMDDSITQEVTNHLFKKAGAKFGMDLVSFNMQRGREFGIPSYMEFRKFCGLPGADTFEELFGSMPNETITRYSTIFQHPSDVDLWSGGVSEKPLPGSMLGPTFACVIATQFSYSRRGDRFWYELPNQPSSFTPEQLAEIRKSRLARLICDNTDLIDTVQLYPMVLPDHEINPRVPCRSGVLPGIDFSKWAEFPTTGHAAQYRLVEEHLLDLPRASVRPKTVQLGHVKPVSQIFFENINKIATYLEFAGK
ncbi:peroxidase isoform X4 [Cephus cinctus]|uniref:Peroxidase isoform X4 n=1 Tax=Cephus cinctus TaxID=211228 RepID=A0AAJ7VYN8_CEPCN|nr:peroxidase isoform X4 [Cephus cinctus]